MIKLSKNQFTQLIKEEVRKIVIEAKKDNQTEDGEHFKSVLRPLTAQIDKLGYRSDRPDIPVPSAERTAPNSKLLRTGLKLVEDFVNKTGLSAKVKEHIIGEAKNCRTFQRLWQYIYNSLLSHEGLSALKNLEKGRRGPDKGAEQA